MLILQDKVWEEVVNLHSQEDLILPNDKFQDSRNRYLWLPSIDLECNLHQSQYKLLCLEYLKLWDQDPQLNIYGCLHCLK